MNYKPLITLKIKEFSEKIPSYSISEIFYSALNVKFKSCEFKKSDILEISDTEFYSLLSKAMEKELEDN